MCWIQFIHSGIINLRRQTTENTVLFLYTKHIILLLFQLGSVFYEVTSLPVDHTFQANFSH